MTCLSLFMVSNTDPGRPQSDSMTSSPVHKDGPTQRLSLLGRKRPALSLKAPKALENTYWVSSRLDKDRPSPLPLLLTKPAPSRHLSSETRDQETHSLEDEEEKLLPPYPFDPTASGSPDDRLNNHCHLCNSWKPERARHCSSCNRCCLKSKQDPVIY